MSGAEFALGVSQSAAQQLQNAAFQQRGKADSLQGRYEGNGSAVPFVWLQEVVGHH